MPSLGELIAPRRLGTDFRWLLASSWTSNLGDGIALSAAPLLIASMTSSPILVAAGRDDAVPAVAAVRPARRFRRRPPRPPPAGDAGRRLRAVDRAGAGRLPRDRQRDRVDRARHGVPLRHGRGLRRHRRQHAAADAGAARRPRASATPGCRPDSSSATSSPGRRWAPSSSRSDRSGRSSCRSSA